jgi:hypothetical protein
MEFQDFVVRVSGNPSFNTTLGINFPSPSREEECPSICSRHSLQIINVLKIIHTLSSKS